MKELKNCFKDGINGNTINESYLGFLQKLECREEFGCAIKCVRDG